MNRADPLAMEEPRPLDYNKENYGSIDSTL
jgi:hypothetical protein